MPGSWQQAADILAGLDPVLRRLVSQAGPVQTSQPADTHFGALVRAVVYQQLAGRAGFGLAWEIPTPTAKELEPLGDPYRPYRSVLAWYCWRAAELYGPAAGSALTR